MKKEQYAKDLKVKDNVNAAFLVKHIALMSGRDGRNYINIILSDKTGDLEARIWNDSKSIIESVHKGDFVWAQGKVNSYQGRIQVIVSEVRPLDKDSCDKEDFILKTDKNVDKLFNELVTIVEGLEDVYLRDLLKNILAESEVERRLKIWPAGKTIHHAYEGGLLEHIHSCVSLGATLASHYKLNRSFVVAGCLLHDLCKIYEMTEGVLTDYTDEGKLIGHVIKILEVVDRASAKISHFPAATKMHLKHILLSHHGEPQHGSPKSPMTSEACLVHYIDLMDSQLASMEQAKTSDNMSGPWTSYVKHLDRLVFKAPLPEYRDYLQATESPVKESREAAKKPKADAPLTQSLADKLKNIKID